MIWAPVAAGMDGEESSGKLLEKKSMHSARSRRLPCHAVRLAGAQLQLAHLLTRPLTSVGGRGRA
jgi:hypothetical protein